MDVSVDRILDRGGEAFSIGNVHITGARDRFETGDAKLKLRVGGRDSDLVRLVHESL